MPKELTGKIDGVGLVDRMMWVAQEESRKSKNTFPMGAATSYRGVLISRGHNVDTTHPMGAPRTNHSIHAELDAIIGTARHHFVGATMWVYRATKNGSPALAKPCANCMNVLRMLKFRFVVYTDPRSDYGYTIEAVR